MTRRQLVTKRRDLLLEHLESILAKSRRWNLAALECVWTEGVGLLWPINRKRDFGKSLPGIGSRESPPDEDVKPWAEAVRHETDPYTKLLVLILLQFGLRPETQLGHLRWGDIRYDEANRPRAVISKGDDGRFKSTSSIIA